MWKDETNARKHIIEFVYYLRVGKTPNFDWKYKVRTGHIEYINTDDFT